LARRFGLAARRLAPHPAGCATRRDLRGRRLVLDHPGAGFGVTVFLGEAGGTKGRVSLEDFERAVSAIPEVQTVEHVLGLYDYRLRVVARDIPDFERVLRRRIMTLPGAGAGRGECAPERGAPPRAAGLASETSVADPRGRRGGCGPKTGLPPREGGKLLRTLCHTRRKDAMALLDTVDPDGLLEFSVVFTDRSLNHMSAPSRR
jgi:Lrp/AsnC family transcriptional regulator, leucine-responsive regulatory protein